jgi:uncharacterized protein (DUF2164 family)
MIEILIPINKSRVKTNTRGFWYSQDNKKTYYDYLKVIQTYILNDNVIEDIKKKYNQEAIFYIDNNIGYCYYNKNKIDILPNKIYTKILKDNLKTTIKTYLKKYGGLTVYKISGNYFIEVFTTKGE